MNAKPMNRLTGIGIRKGKDSGPHSLEEKQHDLSPTKDLDGLVLKIALPGRSGFAHERRYDGLVLQVKGMG